MGLGIGALWRFRDGVVALAAVEAPLLVGVVCVGLVPLGQAIVIAGGFLVWTCYKLMTAVPPPPLPGVLHEQFHDVFALSSS